MVERNIEIFNSFVKEFLDKDSTYKQQTLTFLEYVTEYEKNSKNVKKLAFFSFQRERNVI